eukprot:gb/GEZN01007079.1/.p1 GENE.gb/GEZN01007079.1/~~gb/GEZN01007079.1/.p1  ORF type:complete len:493 (+),score=70.22 gb/GEZN01007079.1/:62-1540(+)
MTTLEEHTKVLAGLRAFFETGATLDIEYRRTQLQQLGKMMSTHEKELMEAVAKDLHKPPMEAFAGEIGSVLMELKVALANLDTWVKTKSVSTPLLLQPAQSWTVSQPLGVVLIIGAWNYPVNILLCPFIGALAAGCCVVLKPSEVTPHTEKLLASLIPKYLDPNSVAVVCADASQTDLLLNQRFDKIMYTGGGRVGRLVMEKAARFLTPVCLELGGKCPAIVDRQVDLKVAARRIVNTKYQNMGQTCIAPDYVLVHKDVKDEFLRLVKQTIESFFGPNPQQSKSLARIVNQKQWQRLAGLLRESKDKVVVGGLQGADEADRFIPPTVLCDVSPSSPLMQDEIFGPILPILTVDSLQDAVSFLKNKEKPLALYIFSNSYANQKSVIDATYSGGVCINDCVMQFSNSNLPFGGVGASGMGAIHGIRSFQTFSHEKPVLTRYTFLDPSMRYPPYNSKTLDIVAQAIKGDPLAQLKQGIFIAGLVAAATSLIRASL